MWLVIHKKVPNKQIGKQIGKQTKKIKPAVHEHSILTGFGFKIVVLLYFDRFKLYTGSVFNLQL